MAKLTRDQVIKKIKEDLSLADEDLSGLDLSETELSLLGWINLSGANLYTANLYKADLTHARLKSANCFKVNLKMARLQYADLRKTNLTNANLSRADLNRARLSKANLVGANLAGANLEWGILVKSNLSDANLYGTNLYRANLCGANFTFADLRKANLNKAKLKNADFTGANLAETDLTMADLRDSNLKDANLFMANLQGADLRGGHFRGVDLSNANLTGAKIYGVWLVGTKLDDIIWEWVDISPKGDGSEIRYPGEHSFEDIAQVVEPQISVTPDAKLDPDLLAGFSGLSKAMQSLKTKSSKVEGTLYGSPSITFAAKEKDNLIPAIIVLFNALVKEGNLDLEIVSRNMSNVDKSVINGKPLIDLLKDTLWLIDTAELPYESLEQFRKDFASVGDIRQAPVTIKPQEVPIDYRPPGEQLRMKDKGGLSQDTEPSIGTHAAGDSTIAINNAREIIKSIDTIIKQLSKH